MARTQKELKLSFNQITEKLWQYAKAAQDEVVEEIMRGDRCCGRDCGVLFDEPGDGHVRTCRACDVRH